MLARQPEQLQAFSGQAKRVLAVFPHPDDESYGPAGLLARRGNEPDGSAASFVMTRGEASSMGPQKGLDPDGVADLRRDRLLAVADELGLDGLLIGDFPDGGMARCPLEEMAGAIGRVIDAYRPHVVIGHDARGVNAHPDHIAAHWAIRRALENRPAQDIRFAMMAYTQDVVDAVAPRLLFPTPEPEIDAVVRLDAAEAAAKERCLEIHEALVTLRADHPNADLLRRPPIERYSFFGEDHTPPLPDVC